MLLRLPGGDAPERYPTQAPGLVGRHNTENALAAALGARLLGLAPALVRSPASSASAPCPTA